MSGGVDSSVAAAMLMAKGFEVIGITMLVCPLSFQNLNGEEYSPDVEEIDNRIELMLYCKAETNSISEYMAPHKACDCYDKKCGDLCFHPLCTLIDSKKVAKKLGIQHFILDLRKEFQEEIIESFAEEYGRGRTPNPCVRCNPSIKFGKLMEYARSLGADYFATGHYARVGKNEKTGEYELLRGSDRTKDQAYVLYRLSQKQLSKIMFPLGEFPKSKIREFAAALNLPVSEKTDSQEICFIPDDDYIKFLKERYPDISKPGKIIHKNGSVLGIHQGLIHYTIGQRKRLGISYPEPLYVLKIDHEENNLIVGADEDLLNTVVELEDIVWIGTPPEPRIDEEGEETPNNGKIRLLCKIRYKQEEAPAYLEMNEDKGTLVFDSPQRAITPGQSAVFYSWPDGDKIIGGGIITG
ncbi:MAG: tRNA 2-thiouridine(34) synthase MnmA [Firmicutes bacterium]|nr:tRNA 2-thiouridine(34) synthase MnmA [Bacillota bacterium]